MLYWMFILSFVYLQLFICINHGLEILYCTNGIKCNNVLEMLSTTFSESMSKTRVMNDISVFKIVVKTLKMTSVQIVNNR